MAEYVRNRRPFATYARGRPRVVRGGEVISTDDPLYEGREHLFESISEAEVRATRTHLRRQPRRRTEDRVEQTTAAPGEKRDVQIPQPAEEPAPEPEPQPEVQSMERPADYAPKGAWVEYSKSRGFAVDPDSVTKLQLIERYG